MQRPSLPILKRRAVRRSRSIRLTAAQWLSAMHLMIRSMGLEPLSGLLDCARHRITLALPLGFRSPITLILNRDFNPAWEAAVLPLNYARELIQYNQALLALFGPIFVSHHCVIVMSADYPGPFSIDRSGVTRQVKRAHPLD